MEKLLSFAPALLLGLAVQLAFGALAARAGASAYGWEAALIALLAIAAFAAAPRAAAGKRLAAAGGFLTGTLLVSMAGFLLAPRFAPQSLIGPAPHYAPQGFAPQSLIGRGAPQLPPDRAMAVEAVVIGEPVVWHRCVYLPLAVEGKPLKSSPLSSLAAPGAARIEAVAYAPAAKTALVEGFRPGDAVRVTAVPSYSTKADILWKGTREFACRMSPQPFLRLTGDEPVVRLSRPAAAPARYALPPELVRFLHANDLDPEKARWHARMPAFTGATENRLRPLEPSDYGLVWDNRSELPFHSMFMAGIVQTDTGRRYAVGLVWLSKSARHYEGAELGIFPLPPRPGDIGKAGGIEVRIPEKDLVKEKTGDLFTMRDRAGKSLNLEAGLKTQKLAMETATHAVRLDLADAMTTANWWNLGNPMFFPDGSALVGHDIYLKAEGVLVEKATGKEERVRGMLCDERNYSSNPVFDWKGEDWIGIFSDDVLALVYRRTHEGKPPGDFLYWYDGFLYLRKTGAYIPLDKAHVDFGALKTDPSSGKLYPTTGTVVCWGNDPSGRLVGLAAHALAPLARAESSLAQELPFTVTLSLLTEEGPRKLPQGCGWLEFDRK